MTRWNLDGVDWRQMGAVEMLWAYHVETFEYLATKKKSAVRRYLTEVGDTERLRAWDAGAFGDESEDA